MTRNNFQRAIYWLNRLIATSHVQYYWPRVMQKLAGIFGSKITQKENSSQVDHPHWWEAYPLNPTSEYFIFHASDKGANEMEYAWQLYEKIIENMQNICERNGAKLCIFNAVESGLLDWQKKWKRIRETESGSLIVKWKGETYPINYSRHTERLSDIANRFDIPMIPNHHSYPRYTNDPHANAEGNGQMAQDLFNFLTTNERTSCILKRSHRDGDNRSHEEHEQTSRKF